MNPGIFGIHAEGDEGCYYLFVQLLKGYKWEYKVFDVVRQGKKTVITCLVDSRERDRSKLILHGP